MKGVFALFGRPQVLKAFHGWATLVWALLIPVSVIYLRESVPWLVLMSVWANFVGHFSSWQATRVEVRQDEQINDNDRELDEMQRETATYDPDLPHAPLGPGRFCSTCGRERSAELHREQDPRELAGEYDKPFGGVVTEKGS